MLGPRVGCFVGFQKGNWMTKTDLAGGKKIFLLQEKNNLAGTKLLAPRQKHIWWGQKLMPDNNFAEFSHFENWRIPLKIAHPGGNNRVST